VQKRIDDAVPGQAPTAREKDGIAPAQMLAAFGMDPIRWKIVADELHGEATASRDDLERFISARPVTATTFRFGFRIKTPQYQAISVVRGDEVYEYSRGHWLNQGSLFRTPQQGVVRHNDRELVQSADEWHALCVELNRGTLVFYYDGLPVAQSPLKPGQQPKPLQVGFGSYMTTVQIRDMFLSTGR
jgi:hypothetical protein